MPKNRVLSALRSFASGEVCPVVIGAFVLLGHVTGLEFYTNILLFLPTCVLLVVSDSVRPVATFSLLFVFQVTLRHSPSAPYYSEYYFEGYRIPILFVVGGVTLVCLIYYLARTGFFRDFLSAPFFLPMCALSAVFLIAGIGSPLYIRENLIFALGQVGAILLDFLILWHGFKRESAERAVAFFLEFSLVMTGVLVSELGFLYLTSDMLFELGYINKNWILFGWGVSNTAGCFFAMLIPANFAGALRSKYKILHYVAFFLSMVACIFTLSRNALLFGGAAFGLCLLYGCFGKHSEKKKLFRILLAVCAVLGTLVIILKWETVKSLFYTLFVIGFGDNDRFRLWRHAITLFRLSPIFGVGFYGVSIDEIIGFGYTSFYPEFVHNTLLQMLASGGIFGIGVYLWYRAATLCRLLKRPSFMKVLIAASAVILLLESLLDCFFFMIYPLFFFNLALAVSDRITCGEEAEKSPTPESQNSEKE